MSKRKYVIDDRRPSLLPKIGSAVIAIGSLASVAAVASPSILPMVQEATASTTTDSFGNPIAPQDAAAPVAEATAPTAAPTLPSRQADSSTTTSPQGEVSGNFTAAAEQGAAQVSPAQTADPVATATPTPTQTPTEQVVALPSLPTAGNTSSPTPSGASGATWESGTGTSTAAGNLSSPTPGGAYYSDDDDDYDDDDDHDDDHEDDDDDDEHDDDDDD